ncbi:hypothetical protein SNEBB_002298 [Seison nebaliae]|nr:hypothetical protein SNEBB_002298 [Seison nebaliae]
MIRFYSIISHLFLTFIVHIDAYARTRVSPECGSALTDSSGIITSTFSQAQRCQWLIKCPADPTTGKPQKLFIKVDKASIGSCRCGNQLSVQGQDTSSSQRYIYCDYQTNQPTDVTSYDSGYAIVNLCTRFTRCTRQLTMRYVCAPSDSSPTGQSTSGNTLIPTTTPTGNVNSYTFPPYYTFPGGITIPQGFTFTLPPGVTLPPDFFATNPPTTQPPGQVVTYTLPPGFTYPGGLTFPPGYTFTLPPGFTLPPNFFSTTTQPIVNPPVNKCLAAPCLNGGTCHNSLGPNNVYFQFCECLPNFTGQICETPN